VASRDVNSREIAFPGLHRASRFRPSTTYRLPFTGMIRVGSPWREGKKRGAIAGWSPVLFPAYAGTPSIDQHSRWWRARNVAKWLGATGGARLGTRSGRSACGRRARESPFRPFPLPVRCHYATGQSFDVAGGWARKTVGIGQVSGAVAHLSKRRHGARWGGGIADRLRDAEYGRPQAYCRAVASFDSEVEKFLSWDREKRRVSLTSLVASLCKGSFICVFVGKSDRPMWLRVARRLTFEREVDT